MLKENGDKKSAVIYYNFFILVGYLSYSLGASRIDDIFTIPDAFFCRWDGFMAFSPSNFFVIFYLFLLSLYFINYSVAAILALICLLLVSHAMTVSVYSIFIIGLCIIGFFLFKQQGKWAIVFIFLTGLSSGYIEQRFIHLKSLGLNNISLQLLTRSTIRTYLDGTHYFFIYQLPFNQTNWRDIAHRHDFVETDKKAFLDAIDTNNKNKIVSLLNQQNGRYYRRKNHRDANSYTWARVNEDTISIVTVN